MPHVEFSLIEEALPQSRSPYQDGGSTNRERWAAVVTTAAEPCLVVDVDSVIVAASGSCAELIGLDDPATARGRRLRDAGGPLVDFTAARDQLDDAEVKKIPPLLAIASRRPARGLMRVACPLSGSASTLDAIATPLWEGDTVVGSLTFFAKV